ncbi:MAG: DNA-binding protein WhiA, partial [Oscillospiraceae bacterium]|nr:DNA-binding protein WhiA [Oscillospiraceae bacterium]
AASAQLEKIRFLDREVGLDNLPPDLQEVAYLRIANPEASLTDLAMLSDPPVSKSGINHRLRKLMAYNPQR